MILLALFRGYFNKWRVFFEARPIYERYGLLVVVLSSVTILCFSLCVVPLWREIASLSPSIQKKQTVLAALSEEYQALVLIDEAPFQSQSLQQSAQTVHGARVRLEQNAAIKRFVLPADRLRDFLQAILKSEPGLSLDALEDESIKHQMVLQFHGDYLSCLRYFERLEDSDWILFFDHLDYQVGKYPNAVIKVVLYTPQDNF